MRIHFQERLETLRIDVIRMGTDANEMVRQAVDAVLTNDSALAHSVMERDHRIDEAERKALQDAISTVMQEAPVAADLRFLVSTLGIVGEVESVADDAVKLARRSTRLTGAFPVELKVALSELGEQARRSFSSALKLYAEYSDELADEIEELESEIDTAYSEARDRVLELMKEDPSNVRNLIRTIEVFHALEHVSDHAVAIMKRLRLVYARPAEFTLPNQPTEDSSEA